LDSRVGSITEALKSSDSLDGKVEAILPQGSWAHQTIIRPGQGLEFDADFLVQIQEDQEWETKPSRYSAAVWEALSQHSTYGEMTTRKDRCIRVTYANDCHIDVVPYVELSSGRQVIVNRPADQFEDTNPVGFTDWLDEKDRVAGRNLRKAIRLLKYLRDHQNKFQIRSVLLTTLLGERIDDWRGTDHYKDVPTTLRNLVADLDDWLQLHPLKPSVNDPSCPTTSFDHRWTEAQYASFRNRMHSLRAEIDEAFDSATVSESVDAWRKVFGDSFPSSIREGEAIAAAVISAATARYTKDADIARDGRAPGEEFIEERFDVRLRYTVEVGCETTPQFMNRKKRLRLRSVLGHIPKWHDLHFKITYTDVPEPFDVYWKVRNRGAEASSTDGGLRGQLMEDKGMRQRTEPTAYTGSHYMDCYIVKDNVC